MREHTFKETGPSTASRTTRWPLMRGLTFLTFKCGKMLTRRRTHSPTRIHTTAQCRFIELNGPNSQPLQQPVDERAVILAGNGRPHGRFLMFDGVLPSTGTLTRVKSSTGMVSSTPARAPRRDSRYEEAYDEVCHEFHQKMIEWHAAVDAREVHLQAAHKALHVAIANGTQPPPYVDPPPKPPMPVMPTKAEFLAHLATGTPGSSYSHTFFGRASASPRESPVTTPVHRGGPSPAHSARDSPIL